MDWDDEYVIEILSKMENYITRQSHGNFHVEKFVVRVVLLLKVQKQTLQIEKHVKKTPE